MRKILLIAIIILATFLRLNNSLAFLPAICGVVAILFTYLLVRKLFKDEKIALLSAFFLSISPWHIHFSRSSWEENIILTVLLIVMYLLFISLKNSKLVFIAIIFFVLAFWLYTPLSVYSYREIIGNYFNYFSGRFLFFEGDWQHSENSSPNVGYLLLVDLPLFISGLYTLFRKRDQSSLFVLGWLLLAPLSSVFTKDNINGAYSLNMVIPLTIVVASGFEFLLSKILNLKFFIKWVILLVGFTLYFSNFTYYLDSYYVHDNVIKVNSDL